MATTRRWLWSSFLLPGIAWLAVLFLVPLGLVVAMSFGTTNVIGQPVYGFHPGNYAQVFQPIFLPILVILLAVVFLGEKMTRPRLALVLAGIAGMFLIVRPGSVVFQSAALFAVGIAARR